MNEIILPPFAPVLMESTRALGYSLETAISDIIDNSITAQSTEICIKFLPGDQPYFMLIDNGYGMNGNELTDAMRYGSKHPGETRSLDDLGRFGLGLKTASLSQCRSLTVISLKDGVLSGRKWDLDFINEKKEWVLLKLSKSELNEIPNISKLWNYEHGTIVMWNKLDRFVFGESSIENAFTKKMPDVINHLSLVFHRYLAGEKGLRKLKIAINNFQISAADPFLEAKSHQILADEFISIDGTQVKVKPYILPHISKMTKNEIEMLGGKDNLRKQQGFYIYRNKRLLVWGTWFRMTRKDDSTKLARVMVDIPNSLDDKWTLDIRKSTAQPPDEVKRALSRVVMKIANGSKRVWTTRGKIETQSNKVKIWDRFVDREALVHYCVNREYPLVVELLQRIDQDAEKILFDLLKIIELNVPINAIRVDINNDARVNSEKKDVLYDTVKSILLDLKHRTDDPKVTVEMISITEPFARFPELIKDVFGEE